MKSRADSRHIAKKKEVNLLRGGSELKLLSNQSDVRALDGV